MLAPRGVFEPAALDFGEVPVDMQRALPVVLKNTGNFKLVIGGVEVPQGFALRGVKGMLEGGEIMPGEQIELEVVFLPAEARAYTGTLVVTDGDHQVGLQLSGVGVIRQVPVLTVSPVGVDFGAVALEETARATVEITNSGTGAALLERATLRSSSADIGPDDFFGIGTPLPLTVEPGATVPFELLFTPSLEAQISDVIVLHAVNHTPLEVGVTGQGVVPLGDVLCTPSRLDYGPVERGQTKILSVDCQARGGPARLISARIPDNPMFVMPSPPRTVDLASGDTQTIEVEFRPDGTPAPQTGTLIVEYSGGMGAATVDVALVGEVIPPPASATAMALKLQWTSNGTDVDLHFVGPGGTFYEAPNDCYYANKTPDWGVTGDTSDNPFLDVDDVDGYGPEEINLGAAAPGRYDAYVHYFADNFQGRTEAIVEVYVAGQLVATRNRPNFGCGQVWHVGWIQWDGSNGVFTPSDQIDVELLRAGCF